MKAFDEAQTTWLKGLGIVLIAGHNFQYLVSGLPGVNEFVFSPDNFAAFVDGVRESPVALPRLSLAYFGHYAVQIFIFLSGYGLALRFAKQAPSYRAFMTRRFVRLYPAFVLAIIAWAIVKQFPSGVGTSVLLKLGLVSNLIPGEQLSLVGPWWFVPFIFQFYLVFPVLMRLGDRALGLLAAAGFGVAIALNETLLPGGFVFATPLGHLPEFCLGLWWARHPARVGGPLVAVAAVVFCVGNVWAPAWYFSDLSVLVLILGGWQWLRLAVTPGPISRLGGLSLELFLVNGFLRDPFMTWARQSGTEWAAWGLGLVSSVSAIALALVIQAVVERLPSPGQTSVAKT